MPVPIRRYWALGLAFLLAAHAGCDPLAREDLAIATTWPAADRADIEEGFKAWLRNLPDRSRREPLRIRWLVLALGDDIEGVASRRHPPDVLLGGPARSYQRLAQSGYVAHLPIDGSPPWAVARTASIVQTADPRGIQVPGDGNSAGIAFDDPRKDPISLAWADAQLGSGSFGTHYARLVRDAGNSRRIGRQTGSAAAAASRGETVGALAVGPEGMPTESRVRWIEGVAIPGGGRHHELAIAFLKFLSETGHAGPIPRGLEQAPPDDLDLLADLLGATLVDAQDELWTAWAALKASGSPESQLRWMTEPPPWPPASITKILDRQGDQAMAMVESLAGQVATEPEARAWLLSSWLSPPRLIDRRILEELTRAAGGRLFRDPRFREWLGAEWTAWARQRYRRVLRSVGSRQ